MSDKSNMQEKKQLRKAMKKDRENKIFDVFFLKNRLIPIPINHRLSKTASLWKINKQNGTHESQYNVLEQHDITDPNDTGVRIG